MFSSEFDPSLVQDLVNRAKTATSDQISSLVNKPSYSVEDIPLLLSDEASLHIETLAQQAHAITLQRFGKTIQLFAPLYLSNICSNECTYCGFSRERNIRRKKLSTFEMTQEYKILQQKGLDHVLLLTGEAETQVGVPYLKQSIEIASNYFSSIGLEVQPLLSDEYRELIQAGCDSLTVYQETYDPEVYSDVHRAGKKADFSFRLDTPDHGGIAGFYRMNIGFLLGLADWRFDAISTALHLQYLQKKYWESQLGISFPRINPEGINYEIPNAVSTKHLAQLIITFRLVFPDLFITLSTRESAELRHQLLPLGITTMSAESMTSPGGYSGDDQLEQFKTTDHRSLESIQEAILSQGYEPVMKNWDTQITRN